MLKALFRAVYVYGYILIYYNIIYVYLSCQMLNGPAITVISSDVWFGGISENVFMIYIQCSGEATFVIICLDIRTEIYI